jgi:hypothetical protein
LVNSDFLIIEIDHPRIPVRLIPSINFCWAKRNITTTGAVIMTVAAIMAP